MDSVIVSDHILNLLQDIEGRMVADKDRLLAICDEYLNLPKEKKLEFQLARRLGMVMRPSQMDFLGAGNKQHVQLMLREYENERQWEDRINMIIERYI